MEDDDPSFRVLTLVDLVAALHIFDVCSVLVNLLKLFLKFLTDLVAYPITFLRKDGWVYPYGGTQGRYLVGYPGQLVPGESLVEKQPVLLRQILNLTR